MIDPSDFHSSIQRAHFIGPPGDINYETDTGTLYLHDGVTIGGKALAFRADMTALDIRKYKKNSDTNWNSAFALAIADVVSLATASGKTYGLPAIEIPGGAYNLTDSITTFPWVMLVSRGPVLLDFSAMAGNKPGFICNNLTSITQDSLKYPGNHAPWLNGADGAIAILGPGTGTSTAAALRLGNFAPGGKPFRDTRICNVVVNGWDSAQEFGQYDTYMAHTSNSRFEGNNRCIKTQSGTGNNSGERMEWINCTFAGSNTVLDHNIDTFDVNFVGCSFDFNGDIVKFGANSQYCAVRLEHPYIESLGGYIVNGAALTGGPNTNQVAVFVSDMITLPRDRVGAQGVNSPSRNLFTGQFSLSLRNVKLRYETRPYVEDGAVIGSDVEVVGATGYHRNPQPGPLTVGAILNADYDFQKDADGTAGTALTAWDRISVNSTTPDLFTVSGKKVLRMVGTSGSNTSNATFRSKQKIPARMGNAFWVNTCLYANGATGPITVQTWMEFFDDADVSLGQFPTSPNYSFSAALTDSTVPNFASGGDRWMDTVGFRAVAPKNTAYGKMRFTVISFDGTVYVSRARCWRDY